MGESTKKFQDFIGKACVQHHIFRRRSRPFLQRNINTVLDAHERLLSWVRTPTDDSNSDLEMLLATKRPRSGWDYPTPRMLEELVLGSANGPALRLSELQIRAIDGANPTTWKEKRRDHEPSSEPSWLPQSSQDFTRTCSVEVVVQESEAGHEVFKSSQQATVNAYRDEASELFFNVRLHDAFRISLHQLFVAISHGQTAQGGARWKRTASKKYRLTVALKCNNSVDHAALLALLGSPSPSTDAEIHADDSIIKVAWSELPMCPKEGTLLKLDLPSRAGVTSPRYGVEINMGWGKAKGSVLERHGAALQEQLKKEAQQLPTPSASEPEKEKLPTHHTVRYEFDEGLYKRTFVADNLKCLFCSGMGDARPAVDYPHISRLYLHYLRQHDHFKFDLIQDDHLPGGVARFLLTHNDKPEPVDDNNGYYRVEGPGEHHSQNVRQNWVAPRRPFDINAYTAGDDSWTQEAHKQGKGKRMTNGTKQARAGASAAQPIKLVKRPALEEIQNLPPHKRRRYMVPDIPGVTFYHTSSKHPAEREDYFSEEDDELEEQRLLHSQRRNFKESGLDPAAIAFHEAFNAHMDREQSGPQILIRDGLVRFARHHRDRMNFASSQWRKLFEEKLNLLISQRVITADIAAFCLEKILPLSEQSSLPAQVNGNHSVQPRAISERDSSAVSAGSQSAGKPKTHKWSGGGADRDIIESGGLSLANAGRSSRSSQAHSEMPLEIPETPEGLAQSGAASAVNGHAWDKGKGVERPYSNDLQHPSSSRHKRPCKCGKVAESQSMRGIISCDNTLCGRDYHLTCIRLDRPIIGWRCPDCVASASVRKPDVPRMVNGTGHPDKAFRPASMGQAVPSYGGLARS